MKDLEYVKSLFKDISKIKGTVLKLDVEEGFNSYTDKVGNPMEENTLIAGDNDNNVFLVYRQHDGIKNTYTRVFKGVSIVPYLKYDDTCILHKQLEPTVIPSNLMNIILQTNIYNNNYNNYTTTNLHYHTQDKHKTITGSAFRGPAGRFAPANNTCSVDAGITKLVANAPTEKFMCKFYEKGGMVPLKDVKTNIEWKNVYEDDIIVKKLNICKSCRRKAHKGCCSEYSANNRVMIKMVIGWSK